MRRYSVTNSILEFNYEIFSLLKNTKTQKIIVNCLTSPGYRKTAAVNETLSRKQITMLTICVQEQRTPIRPELAG